MSNYIFNGRKVMEDINTKIDTLNNIFKENNILKQSKKPPLGPTPKFIFESQCKGRRIIELKEAIKRYLDSNRVTPLSFWKNIMNWLKIYQ